MIASTVVSSRIMTGNRGGDATRQAILLALLSREPRTIRGLADATGRDVSTISHHLPGLESEGFVVVERRRGRLGSTARLTIQGRTTARMLEAQAKTAS